MCTIGACRNDGSRKPLPTAQSTCRIDGSLQSAKVLSTGGRAGAGSRRSAWLGLCDAIFLCICRDHGAHRDVSAVCSHRMGTQVVARNATGNSWLDYGRWNRSGDSGTDCLWGFPNQLGVGSFSTCWPVQFGKLGTNRRIDRSGYRLPRCAHQCFRRSGRVSSHC